MKKLNKKERHLWHLCTNYTMSKPPSANEVWMRLDQQINNVDQSKTKNISPLKTYFMKLQTRYAFALLLFLIMIPTAMHYINTNKIISEYGTINKNIMLSDGTSITLNAGSTVSYTKNYNIKHREVFLDGEAYFNVKKSHTPFIVSTKFAQVEVLGTKFNVRSRKDGFETGVNEGSIKVKQSEKSMILSKGQCAIIQPTNKTKIDKMSTDEFYPGWLNNIITCNETPLEKICGEIQRRYNIKILFKNDSSKRITISGNIYLPHDNINSVMSSISLLAQRELKLEGDTYIIL